MTDVQFGVPQGSVLGPLMYTLFINELPEVIVDTDCPDPAHEPSENLFGKNCKRCGELPCYADDASFVISSQSRAWNQMKITQNLAAIQSFLNNNYLTINMGKTALCEVIVRQKRTRLAGSPPSLTVRETSGEQKVIQTVKHLRLLGVNIQDDFLWKAHLVDGEKAVLPALRQKIGSLKNISSQLPRKSHATLANGIILSKINYIIHVWGGAHEKFIKKLQIILNTSAQFVCNAKKRTSTKSLMEQCKWLYIRESVEYFSLTDNTFVTTPARIQTSQLSY